MKKLSILFTILFFSINSLNAQWVSADDSNIGGDIMALLELNGVLYAGGTAYLFRSSDQGNSWSGYFGPLAYAWTLAKSQGNIFCGLTFSSNQGVYVSTDNGLTWNSTSLMGNTIWSIVADDSQVIASADKIYRTIDNGQSWIPIGVGFTGYLALSGNRIYSAMSGLRVTSNNGLDWSLINSDAGTSVIAEDSLVFFGTQDGKIYRSTNFGQTWETTFNKPGAYVYSLYKYGQYVFAGTDSGFYISTNNGESFISKNDNLGNCRITSILVYNNFVFVANGNYGATPVSVWKRPLTEIVSVQGQNENHPNSFFLSQNYPNPFNPITKISWQSPKGSWQTLKVFDVLGNEITTLINEYKPAGTYEVTWYAESLPTGVYFYRMEASSPVGQTFSETKKMILMK